MKGSKLALAFCVAASCAGCVTETKTVPLESVSSIKGIKEAEGPKRQAQPSTWLAVGNMYDSKANDPKTSTTDQSALRDEARKAYQKAIEIDPKFVPGYIQLANLYLQEDRSNRALEVYQKALDKNPHAAQLWFEKGEIHRKEKDETAALKALAKAQELEPENHRFVAQYGLCLAWANHPQEAVTVLSQVMNKAEADYDVARMMAFIHQPEACRQYVHAALVERPNHAGSLALLAELDGASKGAAPALANAQVDPNVARVSWTPPQ